MLFILNKLMKLRWAAPVALLAMGTLLGACSRSDTTDQIGVYSGRHYNLSLIHISEPTRPY